MATSGRFGPAARRSLRSKNASRKSLVETEPFNEIPIHIVIYFLENEMNETNEWISVSDRLPEFPDGLYVVDCEYKTETGGEFVGIFESNDKGGDFGKKYVVQGVTHWRPIQG